jgi:tetratricopeptide (TPR) repeat protein
LNSRQSIKPAIPRLLFLLVIPLVLGFSTHQYSKTWQSDVSLWTFVKEKQPDNIYAAIYLAEAYYSEKRFEEALPLYQRAYTNRALISPDRRINIFINRYFDTAYHLELYQEAEIAIYTGMQEKRLWFMPPAEIYYNAALINIKLEKLETALKLVEMASQVGDDEEKFQLLKERINKLIENQP